MVKAVLIEPNPSGLCKCGCNQKTIISKRTRYACGHVKGKPINYIKGHNADGRYFKPFIGQRKGCKWEHSFTALHRKRLSDSHKGSKSYLWKGGITRLDKLERTKFRIKMQKLVFERDGYACVIGGKEHGSNLQVDHIQSWKDYVDQRFNINNCRTLCMKCHYEITFGKPMPPTVRAWGHNYSKGGYLQ